MTTSNHPGCNGSKHQPGCGHPGAPKAEQVGGTGLLVPKKQELPEHLRLGPGLAWHEHENIWNADNRPFTREENARRWNGQMRNANHRLALAQLADREAQERSSLRPGTKRRRAEAQAALESATSNWENARNDIHRFGAQVEETAAPDGWANSPITNLPVVYAPPAPHGGRLKYPAVSVKPGAAVELSPPDGAIGDQAPKGVFRVVDTQPNSFSNGADMWIQQISGADGTAVGAPHLRRFPESAEISVLQTDPSPNVLKSYIPRHPAPENES